MTLKEMRERMTALVGELDGLVKTESRSAEQESRMDAILGEMNDLGPKIDREVNAQTALDASRQRMSEPNGKRVSGEPPVDGAEGTEKRDHRPPVKRFLESEAFRHYQKHPKGTSGAVEVGSFNPRHQPVLEFGDEPIKPEELRALIYSGTASASFLLPDVLPGIRRGLEPELVMRDVLLNARTTSDAITVLQESGFTNNAAEVAEATAVNEGAKPESALTLTEATFPVRTIAHWIPITRQMLEDLPFMETYVEERLITGIRRREDNQFINGDGVAPNLTGLLNTSGIQDLDAAYFTANAVVNAGQSVENFNRILRAKRVIRTDGEAVANFVVLNPSDLEELLTVGDANRQYYGPGPFATGGIPQLWRMAVVESENIAAGTALVGDGSMAAVVDRMDARIYMTDSHSDYFVRNILVILAEERVALPVFRPAAFAAVELA